MKSMEQSVTISSPPPAVAMRQEFRDFDEFAETILGWGLDWVQLDRGPLHARLQQVATPSTLLTRFWFSRKFHQRGTNPPGMRTFGFIGPSSPHIEWRGEEGSGNHIIVFPPNDEFDCVSHAGFHGDTLSVYEDRLRSVADVMGVPDLLESLPGHQAIIEADPRRVEAVRQSLTGTHTSVAAAHDGHLIRPACAEADFEIVAALVAALATSRNSESHVSA